MDATVRLDIFVSMVETIAAKDIMKRTQHKLTKMQRQARSKRKTWTNAERFANKEKNALRLLTLHGGKGLANKFIADATQEIADESLHVHGENCNHKVELEVQDVPNEVINATILPETI